MLTAGVRHDPQSETLQLKTAAARKGLQRNQGVDEQPVLKRRAR